MNLNRLVPCDQSAQSAQSAARPAIFLAAILILISALLIVSSKATASDDLQRLSAEEISELLTGNTAIGTWDGTKYRQYFSDSGTTIYAQEGSRSSRGTWRVNKTENVYESKWERTGWSGYPVGREGDKLFWISTALPPQPFEVVPGEQLVP